MPNLLPTAADIRTARVDDPSFCDFDPDAPPLRFRGCRSVVLFVIEAERGESERPRARAA